MMKHIKKEKQRNSLKNKNIRKAAFVSTEDDYTERFKYNFWLKPSKYINKKFAVLKNIGIKFVQSLRLRLDKFDFAKAFSVSSIWLINAFIEGIIINFAVWGLLGWDFNLITIMAWGFVVKQTIDIYWRLKTNGSNTKLIEKN